MICFGNNNKLFLDNIPIKIFKCGGSLNYGSLPFFVNKILLSHSCVYLFMYRDWPSKPLKILFGPLQIKFTGDSASSHRSHMVLLPPEGAKCPVCLSQPEAHLDTLASGRG